MIHNHVQLFPDRLYGQPWNIYEVWLLLISDHIMNELNPPCNGDDHSDDIYY